MEVNDECEYHIDRYDYALPNELIAQAPSSRRESSRLLVLSRSRKEIEHRSFEEISSYVIPGDVLVVNDTRVVSARLTGIKDTGGRIELLVLDPYKNQDIGFTEGYWCLVKAAKPPKPDTVIHFQDGTLARVLSPCREGKAAIRFQNGEPLLDLLNRLGTVPLPPYIHRDDGHPCPSDKTSYQTVYADRPGAVAAPTAGLHFSSELLKELDNLGVEIVPITLHVGYGTFAPIRVQDLRDHQMHSEFTEVSQESAEKIERAHRDGRRVIAVGTTVVRTLEWVMLQHGRMLTFSGFCNHYIYPGYKFLVVDAMVTNFHLPKSTLLLLVSAFAGREPILNAYREAVRQKYRFFSYGDAMLIL